MDREILKKIPLFRSVSPEEAERMLGCLNAVRRRYEPEERILWAGQAAERLGAVLEGKVQIIREDEDGTRTILLTVLISSAAAVLFPVKDQEAEHDA